MRWLSIAKSNPFVLPMAVVAGLAIFFISEGSYWQSVDTINDLRGMASARQNLQQLERALADAEMGQRGYLLTGQADYLQSHAEARRSSVEALQMLERYFSGDAPATHQLDELRVLTLAKLDEGDETVRLMRADQRPAALQLMQGAGGRKQMERVSLLTEQLLDTQTLLRHSTNQMLDRTLLLSRYGVATLSAVLMLALVLYLRKSEALAQAQTAQSAALKAANDRLEAEVFQRTAQLTDLTRHLLSAREDERHRLARNLHDDLGSLLTAAKLDAARIRSRMGTGDPELQARLADLVEKLNGSIALGRSIVEDLRPSTLSHLGLLETLAILADDFSLSAGIPVHQQFRPVHLNPSGEIVVYRVVQEAMTNLGKHAHAQQVWITVGPSAEDPGLVKVTVRDDGDGFDAATSRRSAFGLLGMRFRVEAEGGSLLVRSRPGQGTEIEVTLPASAAPG